jgi:uncharacterized protein YkvS
MSRVIILNLENESGLWMWYQSLPEDIRDKKVIDTLKIGIDVLEQVPVEPPQVVIQKETNEAEVKSLNDLLMHTVNSYEQKEARNQAKIEMLTQELDRYKNDNYEIKHLKSMVKERENEIAKMKMCNTMKGNLGESLVRELLSKQMTMHEIQDMSACGGMSDMHLVNHKNERIVVECKNKHTIALSDVEKSLRDIECLVEEFGDKFVGYLFVSIRSCNIPRKGEFYIEYIKGRPILWYGMDVESNESYEKEFGNVIKIMNRLCLLFKGGEDKREDLQQKLNLYFSKIKEQKKLTGTIISSMKTMRGHVEQLNNNITFVFDDMSEYLMDVTSVAPGKSFTCSICDRTFKTQGGLTKHLKTCSS